MLGAWQTVDAQDTFVSSPAVILGGEAGVSDSCWGWWKVACALKIKQPIRLEVANGGLPPSPMGPGTGWVGVEPRLNCG